MHILALVLLTMLSCVTRAGSSASFSSETTQQSNSNGSQIEISIATGGGLFQPAKNTYRVGEPVPVVITMTNKGTQPIYVCESGTLYQDRPQLLKDGSTVSYMSFTQWMMRTAEKNETCDKVNLPQQILLPPNEPTVVDWFILAEGITSWYEPLQPGKYTLSNRRRLSCCDGPLIETNAITFEVVP